MHIFCIYIGFIANYMHLGKKKKEENTSREALFKSNYIDVIEQQHQPQQ